MDIAGSLCREQIAHIPPVMPASPRSASHVYFVACSPCGGLVWRGWFRGHVQVKTLSGGDGRLRASRTGVLPATFPRLWWVMILFSASRRPDAACV